MSTLKRPRRPPCRCDAVRYPHRPGGVVGCECRARDYLFAEDPLDYLGRQDEARAINAETERAMSVDP